MTICLTDYKERKLAQRRKQKIDELIELLREPKQRHKRILENELKPKQSGIMRIYNKRI